MTQQQTWWMHFVVSALICLPAWYFQIPEVAYIIIGFALGRERRDHEIKNSIPAKHFHRHWDMWNWSADGKADFLTAALPAVALLVVSYQ